jgi:hypothetical protein
MAKPSNNVLSRVGVEPEARLRWLLRFGNLDLDSLTLEQKAAVLEEARAFAFLQEIEPPLRARMRFWPPPIDATPNVLAKGEAWSAQRWLKQGLDLLSRGEKWSFVPRVRYELDAHRDLFWARLRANSRLEQFKALAYDAFRDARFRFRLCPECKRPFVPVRRQRYCSSRCSQAVRTRKWRKVHPEKNREIRRQQYRRSVTTKLGCLGARRSRSRNTPRITEADDNGEQKTPAANRSESHVGLKSKLDHHLSPQGRDRRIQRKAPR